MDPTGNGGVVAGFGDQRELELLVEAGFTPVEAVHCATENGAQFLKMANTIGTIQDGEAADLVVVRGNLNRRISDIEHVETVFQDGVGWNSAKLIQPVRGQVGVH